MSLGDHARDWDGSGYRAAGLTLTDDEVRALVRNATINTTPADTLTTALTVMERLRYHAEELINEERSGRRYEVPTDPALETGCEGCE